MNNFKLFVKSMKVMGDRLFIYLFAILGMSIGTAMFSVMGSLLMKSVVDIAQMGGGTRYWDIPLSPSFW